jgi:hypothetical protein
MTETPVSLICYNENKIKRLIIDRALSEDEIKHSRLRIGAEFMKNYNPKKHTIDVIIKDKE